MKKTLPFFCALLCAGALVSCSTQMDDMQLAPQTEQAETGTTTSDQFFPVEDDAVLLSGEYHERALNLLHAGDPKQGLSLYDTKITEEQYQEIKTFTDDLVKGLTTQKEIHDKIFSWVNTNVKYQQSDNDAYAVFKNKTAICQGYSNLLKVMLISQGVPAVSANGFAWNQGHAWIYTCLDGLWYLSDATNNIVHDASNITKCKEFIPYFLEWAVYEDDKYLVEFSGGELTLVKVKSGDSKFTVPYSAKGFVLTAFIPESDLPENIKEIYIGKNINSITNQGLNGLSTYGLSIEQVHVDPANPTFEYYEGVIYTKMNNTTIPHYIPNQMKRIVLKPSQIYSKGLIVGHQNVEEIVFPKGVKYITDFAIEACPKLKRVYIPADAEISRHALYGMGQSIEIIREKTETGIPTITMD